MKKGYIVTLLAFSIVAIPTFGEAAKISVCASGCDVSSIQDAVDIAKDGDVIIVRAGTYSENVLVDESVTIKGVDGADNTTVESANGGTAY